MQGWVKMTLAAEGARTQMIAWKFTSCGGAYVGFAAGRRAIQTPLSILYMYKHE